MVGRFFIPFGLLLMRSTKKAVRTLCLVAGWIIFMQMLDMYIVIMPELHRTGVRLSIIDFLPIIGIGATLGFFFLRIVGKASLFPVRDPRLLESLRISTYPWRTPKPNFRSSSRVPRSERGSASC
jgi:hypothetical protein